MGKLFKYWKDHIGIILVIIALLVVQAYCDLALPSYTSDIVDVGITNGGIENVAPEKMSAETYENICLLLSDDEIEVVNKCYKLNDNGIYKLTTDNQKNIDKLNDIIGIPIVMISGMESKQDGSLEQMKAAYAAGMMSKEDILAQRKAAEDKMDEYGDTMISSQATVFVKAEYKKVGVDTDKIQTNYLIKKGLTMLGYAIIGMIASIFAGLLASILAARVGMTLRNNVFKRVVSYSNTEMDKFSTASLITRSTNDVQQIQLVTTLLLRMVIYAPILGVGGVIKVVNTKSGMGWVIFVAVAVILLYVGILVSLAMPKFKIMQVMVDKVNLVSREILTGLSVIRAFGREKREEERFEEANKDLTKTMLFVNRVMTFMMPGMMFIMYCITVLIVWVAAHRIDGGYMQIGSMTAFITYAMLIVMSFLMLTMMSVMLPRAGVAAERIDEVINTPSSVVNAENVQTPEKKTGIVRFENVNFMYPGAKENVIKNINFMAEPGKTTAIIGSTGSGKSTLINLIPRLYDVTSGEITVDGIDIRKMDIGELRERIGYVPQKGILFSGTIADNLKFGNKDASDDEMITAAEIAQATEFIEEKNDKYESFISQGGGNVSGGQKQRLSIARAITKNPDIYIFDDSFSALDLKTDAILRKELAANVSDATVIIVAQRISTILHADQILVMDDGKIVGKGTHEELMKTCETYQQIASSQLSAKELGKEA